MKTDQAVSILRSFAQSTEKTPSPLVREAADDYCRACNELNSALSRLEEMLSKSLRTEAIHYANIEPKLEDQAAMLEFPGKETFVREAPFNDLPVPPAINMDAIKYLQTAYAEYSITENLYRTLRRQVLEKTSFKEKLHTLQEINNHDRINSNLIEDIEKLEKTYQARLLQTIRKAIKENDHDQITILIEEYYSMTWTMPPAPEVADLLEIYRGQQLENKLKIIANQASRDMRNKDIVGAKKLFDTWLSVGAKLGAQEGDRYWSYISPVANWIRLYDELVNNKNHAETELIKLKNVLRTEKSDEEARKTLKKITYQYSSTVNAINNYNKSIPNSLKGIVQEIVFPKELKDEYKNRVAELERLARWSENFILACVFGAGTLIIISFLIYVVSRSR